MRTTIKDVANRAGVSITTVSHVINKTRFVSEERVWRVQAAMEELNYQPNTLARSLRMGETKTIGLIVPDNSNPFFAEISRVIEDIGFKKGYGVFLCNSDGILEKEAAYIRMLIAKQVDGVVFIAAENTQENLMDLTRRNFPVVVVDRDMPDPMFDVVLVNNEQGGCDAVNYLLSLGHTRIACITGPSQLTPAASRVEGYRHGLLSARIPIAEELIVPGDFRSSGGEKAMEQLLQLDQPPSAVFACNDLMAIGALRAMRNHNLRVPQDISVIGFDDISISVEVTPALTTVAQPIEGLATCAAELLIKRIQNDHEDEPAQRVILDTQLVVRDSCAPYTANNAI
jgi:LacI family transcriptional regulator, galactose operon repressor